MKNISSGWRGSWFSQEENGPGRPLWQRHAMRCFNSEVYFWRWKGWVGGKEWGRRGRTREALWKGSRLQREWGQQGGGRWVPLLHWPNATAAAAVKRGLPFFPRPSKRAQTVAQARQGQVTALIYTLGLCAHNADTQLIYSVCGQTCAHTATSRPKQGGGKQGPWH